MQKILGEDIFKWLGFCLTGFVSYGNLFSTGNPSQWDSTDWDFISLGLGLLGFSTLELCIAGLVSESQFESLPLNLYYKIQ